MKKLIAFVLALMIVVLGMFGCSNNESSESNTKTEPKSLYAQGLEVIQMMSEMTRTEES